MRLVVVLDCLQPSAPVLGHRAGLPLGALGRGPSVVLVPDARPGPTWSGGASLNPRRATTGCAWTFTSPHPGT
jgi:hypothetical protein